MRPRSANLPSEMNKIINHLKNPPDWLAVILSALFGAMWLTAFYTLLHIKDTIF